MRRMFTTLILALAGSLFTLSPATAVNSTMAWEACTYEDGSGQPRCVWNARDMGNGEGHSLIIRRGGTDRATYMRITHNRAARLIREGQLSYAGDPRGSWDTCFWNGTRWNAPCAFDHRHTSVPGASRSFAMYPSESGQIRTDYISHQLAHYLLGL